MKITFYIPFLLLGLIFSCSKPNPITQTIQVHQPTDPSDLRIDNPQLIRLSPNPFSEISGIDKILFAENRIIILDQMKGNTVFIYDRSGEYINHIYSVGEGPGEYRRVENIFYSPIEMQLVLIPMDFDKKMYFDLDGNFLKEEFHEHSTVYADLFFLRNGEILINNSAINGEPNLKVSQNGKTELIAFPFDPLLDDSPLDQTNLISQIDEHSFLLSIGLRDTLYSLDLQDFSLKPSYFLDFGNGPSYQLNEKPDPIQFFLKNDIYVGAIDLFHSGQFISFTTLHHSGLQGRIFSKEQRILVSTEDLILQEIGSVGYDGIKGLTTTQEFAAVLSSGEDGIWDFSQNPKLQKQFESLIEVDQEELILLLFSIEEK
ncbi:6-bladed beta-propeller [Algoriphagus sp. D3-2-R+10]|uniref:6-bladed beta-propeller n=1 Tax=Algoriphagus aurantiacus TaxID=3103948 RepID=UPI002B366482|nr:6-bladed beta-propeller [Algoriphagus sp. D3-2-R+10]MEB2775671.1 6-bladed beta-propeller [Algoriphagus sp. D3-2-R+10]